MPANSITRSTMSPSWRRSASMSELYFFTCAASARRRPTGFAGRADDGERRLQLVRHRRDKLHLLPRQPSLALRGRHHQDEARAQQAEDAEADRQVAPA